MTVFVATVRGGGKKYPTFTSQDAWNYCFKEMTAASDKMVEPSERRTQALVGVAWARVAYLMERSALTAPTPRSEP